MKYAHVNEPVVRRNARIAQITMIAGLIVLAGGMYVSFAKPEQFGISIGALMLGFALSQIGIYYSNRWGRRPRSHDVLNAALKGLDNKYALYHYYGPVQHMLVAPSGIWVLLPYYQRGRITYDSLKKRWHQKGSNWYMKFFAQEGIGRPDLDVAGELENLNKFLAAQFPGEEIPVQAALVFFNDRATIDIPSDSDAPAYTVAVDKLKDLVRQKSKERRLSVEKADQIRQILLPDSVRGKESAEG